MKNIFKTVYENLAKSVKLSRYVSQILALTWFVTYMQENLLQIFKNQNYYFLRENRQPVFLPVELLYDGKSVVVGSLRESQMLEHYHQTGDAALPDDDGWVSVATAPRPPH